jgi:hypothetical protein
MKCSTKRGEHDDPDRLTAYQDAISRIRFAAFGTERADAEALARVQAILRELDKGVR